MNAKAFNLGLMIFWLIICIALLTRDFGWMPEALHEKVSGPQTPLVILLTGVLAAWNFMRFWVANRFGSPPRPSATAEAYRRRIRSITGEDPKVVNPEFNFDDPPAGDSPRNSS
jgi:hypothetical protein